ncbi:MAG: DUF5107 domain-containing protein [Clostridia bacterium]|nr:DUF5107 domain-containing protein [Clostridia bacterium]
MIKFEDYVMPAASMGELNPMPDIKNISYIHAGYEVSDKITEEEKRYIGKGMIPTLLPYKIQDGYDREKKPRAFKAAVLENDLIKVVFLPEMGARLWSVFDKKENRELLYVNPVFQPGNLGLRNAWFSGGVEFNVGIKGHNPLTCSPMWCAVDKTPEGEVLRMYEFERIRGVVYSISAFVPDNSPVLYIKGKIENTTSDTTNMYWWSNIAVDETKGTRVIVPTDDSFLCFYNADHYDLDKASIPNYGGMDVSYPGNIPGSRDFFYKIPPKKHKWIATANEQGCGLLQCSTPELIGRKLFVWGMGQGGRHWNEWLSEEGSAYIEIQAGLAHTQLEHIPMPGNTVWEWTEAYTSLSADPGIMHGDYKKAVDHIEKYMTDRLGDPDKITFPSQDNVTESTIIYKGSDWGYIEERVRGEKISSLCAFPSYENKETKEWKNLLDTNTFPAPDVNTAPESYVVGDFWLEKLKAVTEQNWYTKLHIGVIEYAKGNIENAKKAWEQSVKLTASPWALRNLAMLYKNELGDLVCARKYLLEAFNMKKDCRALCNELASLLTTDGGDLMWLDIYDTLADELKNTGRLRLLRAVALIHLERLEEATLIINKDFVMSDIKEGELSVSHLWFELYRKIYAKENGIEYDSENKELIKKADEKYPLPKSVDFRMHD